jgi:hypothetical protein
VAGALLGIDAGVAVWAMRRARDAHGVAHATRVIAFRSIGDLVA